MIDAMGLPQTAVVVGGSSDIARAVLRRLVPLRLKDIILLGRDIDAMESVADELRALNAGTVKVEKLEIKDVDRHAAIAKQCASDLGHVDLVLVAAGALGTQELDEHDPPSAAAVIETNFVGAGALMLAFADVLRSQGQGHMVVLSSVAGVRARRSNFIYGASKAGLDAFCQGLADALQGSGASLTIVRPGWVATKMTEGRSPAPFATTAEAVATDILKALADRRRVVWSPAILRAVFAVFRLLPQPIWRRIDR